MSKSRQAFAQYTKAEGQVKQRLVGASFGEVGTLKTTFWASAPGPILFQSLDHGLEGVIEDFQTQKDIYVVEYESSTTGLGQDAAIEMRDKFEEDFVYGVAHARTIVWDKESQVYDIFKYAEFGAPSDRPANYYPLFQRYRRLINRAKAADVNFGIIQGMRTPWIPAINKKTGAETAKPDAGARIRRGMPEIDELVHLNMLHLKEEGEFFLAVGKARGPGGRAIQDQTLPFMLFPEFAQLVFPDSQATDWE